MGKRTLRFQYGWLNWFKWLAYSKVEDGAFCRFCVLFGNKVGAGVGNQPVGALCVMKFNKWKNALEHFSDHESSKNHCDSVLKAECTLSIESGKQDSVAVQLNHQAKQQVLDNKENYPNYRNCYLLRQTRNSFERTSRQRSAFFRGSRIRRYQRRKLSSFDSI